jgi:CubicO group peptidase (beta-lactamase class C family)
MKKLVAFLFCFYNLHSLTAQHAKPVIDIRTIQDSIQILMREEKITGLMLGIATRDSILLTAGYGYADLEAGRKTDNQTLFRLGSISKMFISAAILKLVQEGKLSLYDNLKTIAPDVPFTNRWESTDPVKIIHLLEHTTGFDDIKLNRMYSLDTAKYAGKAMMMQYEGSMISRWPPGERFSYSNPNYTILGYVLELKTGMPFNEYVKQAFFQPLAMLHSNFNLRRKNANDVAEYAVLNGRTVRIPSVASRSGAPGALWSSAADMVHFIQFLLNNGDTILSSSMLTQMETARTPIVNKQGIRFGYALGNENNNYPTARYPMYGHNGLTGSCFSSLRYNRDLGVGFILSTNSNYSGRRIEEFLVRKLQENFPVTAVEEEPLDIEAAKPYLGWYVLKNPRHAISAFADELQFAPRLKTENGKLIFQPLIGNASPLRQMGNGIYTFNDCTIPMVALVKNEDGEKIMQLGGLYFVRQNAVLTISYRLAVVASIVLAASVFILLPFFVFGVAKRKLRSDAIWVGLVVAIGVAGLIGAVISLLHVQTFTFKLYELGAVNSRTLTIFSGTLLFGVAALSSVIHRMLIFRKKYPVIYKWYYTLLSSSMFFLFMILLINGWIGMRFWAM